jgi:hypothetical protein
MLPGPYRKALSLLIEIGDGELRLLSRAWRAGWVSGR